MAMSLNDSLAQNLCGSVKNKPQRALSARSFLQGSGWDNHQDVFGRARMTSGTWAPGDYPQIPQIQ